MRCQKGCLKSNMIDKRKTQLVKFVNMLSYHISATRGISVTLNDTVRFEMPCAKLVSDTADEYITEYVFVFVGF